MHISGKKSCFFPSVDYWITRGDSRHCEPQYTLCCYAITIGGGNGGHNQTNLSQLDIFFLRFWAFYFSKYHACFQMPEIQLN
jgi:hypothetical protein